MGRPPALAPLADARDARAARPRDRARRRRAAALHVRARAVPRAGHARRRRSAPTPSSCTAAPRRSRCSALAGPARRRGRGARRRAPVRPGRGAAARAARRRRRRPPPGEPLLARPRARRARASACRADAVLVEESPSSRPELLERIHGARRRWASSPTPTAASASASPSAIGLRMGAPDAAGRRRARRRLGDVLDPVAVDGGPLRCRRAARRDGQRRATR